MFGDFIINLFFWMYFILFFFCLKSFPTMILEFFVKVYIIVMFIFQISNLLYIDQLIGTGFSYFSDICCNEEAIRNDQYVFLQVCSLPQFGLILIFFCNYRI